MDETSSESSTGRVKRLCNSTLVTFNLPSLPKLHGRSTLVTTKLCEHVYKSITPHMFDLSTPKKYISSTLLEYNSLQDPHLRSYFHYPPRKHKLKKTGFITDDLDVICSLKKYNAYRNFLEDEFMKVHHQKFEEAQKDQLGDGMTEQVGDSSANEREEKRRKFFEQQEKKLRVKQRQLRRLELEEEKVKERETAFKKVQKEKAEMKREAELEEKRIKKLKTEHEEAFRRKSLIDQAHIEEYLRLLQLHKMKETERAKHMNELESRWERYERHAQLMHEEAERKRRREQKEKERNVQRRERLFKILQKRDEERKQKILDENHQQVQLIFVEAEKFENHWKKALNEQRVECRDHMKKQHENWNMQQRRLSLRPTSARNSITSSGSNDEENILLGAIDTASLDSKGEESSFVPVLEPVTEDVERIVDPATNNPIVVESLSDEEVVPSLQISQGNDQDVATSSSSNSEIGTVLSCEVQSSSSKTKSVRFDIPKSDI